MFTIMVDYNATDSAAGRPYGAGAKIWKRLEWNGPDVSRVVRLIDVGCCARAALGFEPTDGIWKGTDWDCKRGLFRARF
jgi:hypothetical protein